MDADLIAITKPGQPAEARSSPIELLDVPVARVLKAGVTVLEEPARSMAPGFSAEAIREAEKLGSELRELNLPRTRSGQTLITADALIRAVRQYQARPITEPTEERIPTPC